MASKRRKPAKQEDTSARVLCVTCSTFFQTPRQCLECSNWNVCLPCLEKESQATRAALARRGIVLP